jgi:hypothetical protein
MFRSIGSSNFRDKYRQERSRYVHMYVQRLQVQFCIWA